MHDEPSLTFQPHGSSLARKPRFHKINRHRPHTKTDQNTFAANARHASTSDVFARSSGAMLPGAHNMHTHTGRVQPVGPFDPIQRSSRLAPDVEIIHEKAPLVEDVLTGNKPSASSTRPSTGRRHVVRPGDTLWSLARHYYGQPRRWRDILAANPGLKEQQMAIGSTIVVPH